MLLRLRGVKPVTFRGAVIREDADPRKQSPIPGVDITAILGELSAHTRSDASGSFSLKLRPGIKLGEFVTLRLRHSDYQPLELRERMNDGLCIARMTPVPEQTRAEPDRPEVVIANVFLRYYTSTANAADVGSGVKTFEIVNAGNVPCNGRPPCSPDGKWKAAIGSASLDAGQGNEFRDARVSCIAGPCPFTKIEEDGFSRGGRVIRVSVLNWSDTTTFLLEAEVVHPMISGEVRESYPVIFGREMSFTLPARAQGVNIEAEINGTRIVFPLGPALYLSWADCESAVDREKAKLYRCELEPGYRFKGPSDGH
jgi:hypothetical protein